MGRELLHGCVYLWTNRRHSADHFGTREPALAHQTDKYCDVAKIHEAVAIYGDMLFAWCDDTTQFMDQSRDPAAIAADASGKFRS